MDETTRTAIADALRRAAETGEAIDPLTATHPGITLADAYAVQLLGIALRVAAGARIVGHKVGLTSAAMQRQLGVDQPDYGHLLDDMVFDPDHPIPIRRFLQPRVEPEVAFVLGADLAGPGLTIEQVAAAVRVARPSLELIDSRIRDWRIGLFDTIADNASSGGVVLGADEVDPDAVDLAASRCVLTRNGDVVGTGTGDAVMGHPLTALRWLANSLGARGVVLRAGQVVLPGSVTAAIPVASGDVVTASFEGVGAVTAHFGDGDDRAATARQPGALVQEEAR